MTTKHAKIERANNQFFGFVKAISISLIISFALVIIFALAIKYLLLPDSTIIPVNLAIKAISVILGTIIITKDRSGGLKKGLLFGLIYTAISFLIFSAISAKFALDYTIFLDLLFSMSVGAIVGVIRVNSKK
ncbi:MAG: TIGR04086 family membrane protein [Clostridia bacterium]|nr:TIGR04086 family membrane protein [Clostridia bacterium]